MDKQPPAIVRQNATCSLELDNEYSELIRMRSNLIANWKSEWGEDSRNEILNNSSISLERILVLIRKKNKIKNKIK